MQVHDDVFDFHKKWVAFESFFLSLKHLNELIYCNV